VFRIGSCEIDPSSGDVRDGRRTMRLQPQAVQVLLALVEHPGRVVTREELQQQLWPDSTVDFEDGLNHAVAKVREALRDPANVSKLIETIPRRGYRFIGTVERTPDDAPRPATDEHRGLADVPPIRRRIALLAVLLAMAAVAAALWGIAGWRDGRPAADISAIAVLPFADMSADRSQEYLADGIAEELISELAKVDSLRVISRTSTSQYRGTTKALPQIASELSVDGIVEGSVQRSGDRVRVAVNLVRASSEQHVWAQTYDVQVGDVLSLRADLARDIVEQIGRRVRSAPASARRVPAEAYEAFLVGRSFMRPDTQAMYAKAIGYFERAIAIAPDYVEAYTELADAHGRLALFEDRRGEHYNQMLIATRQALQLAPDSPEAQLRLADVAFYWDWDWSQCETAIKRARDRSPGSADALEHHAACLLTLGRFDEALRELKHARELDPLDRAVHLQLWHLLEGKDPAGAVDAARKALDLAPEVRLYANWLGYSLLQAGRPEEALAAFIRADRIKEGSDEHVRRLEDAFRTGGAAALEREARAQHDVYLRNRLREYEAEHVSPTYSAGCHALLGDTDKAFEALDRAYAERCPILTTLKYSWFWKPLRADPRYVKLLERMGLPLN
jgi:TolB-like protein/DNA-binding winged helix-turn-helix (wHTH) protein